MAPLGESHQPDSSAVPVGDALAQSTDQSQIDFELQLFTDVLRQHPNYVDVLRLMSKLLTLKGRYQEGLQVDRRLVQLCADDPLAHYNLACRYARLKRSDHCLRTLRRAFELGYCDFCYVREDRDLASMRNDPRFQQLLREHEARR